MLGEICVMTFTPETVQWPQVIEHSSNGSLMKGLERDLSRVIFLVQLKCCSTFFDNYLISLYVSLSQMGSSDLQVVKATMRVAWRCITGDSGALSVMTAGLSWIHMWCADSWDLSKIHWQEAAKCHVVFLRVSFYNPYL